MSDSERISIGAVDALPVERAVAVADGRAVAIRVGDRFTAYVNRCSHQDQSLDGGWVDNGVLSCPAHFWRFDVHTGAVVGRAATLGGGLRPVPTDVVDGEGFVIVDPPATPVSIRDQLLDHARTWSRHKGPRT